MLVLRTQKRENECGMIMQLAFIVVILSIGGCMTALPNRKAADALDIDQAKKSLNGHDPIEFVFCSIKGAWKCKNQTKKTSIYSLSDFENDDRDDVKPLITVEFATGSHRLSDRAKSRIQSKLSVFTEHQLVVAGYTDDKGRMKMNEILAHKRSNSVKDFLVNLGSQSSDIVTEANPLCCYLTENTTSSTRRKNRRVEIILRSTH